MEVSGGEDGGAEKEGDADDGGEVAGYVGVGGGEFDGVKAGNNSVGWWVGE